MNRSQRIEFISGNTDNIQVKVRLEQDVDTIEFLSMNITTEEAYQDFNSDYGVLIGRVIANGGIGIPNAKISVFIPLTDEDELDGTMSSIYPYKTPRDVNADGKRYNLLPRVSCIDPITNTIYPKQPFGSFPIKEEIITDMSLMNMYKKYYKYTTRTNGVGDYMIFGVPVGVQTVHMSVDITDIGKYSMTPASMINSLGYSSKLFNEDQTSIKSSNDLDDLPNIETQEITVDIIPFWGDKENFDIGLTRQDFRIRSSVSSSFTLFASVVTDNDDGIWGAPFFGGADRIGELYRADNGSYTWGMRKRIGTIIEKIYYYPPEISDADIDAGNVDPFNDMKILDSTQYTTYKRDGDIIIVVNCNRNKIITDEFGNEIPIAHDSPNGIFTKFRGFITIEYDEDEIPMTTKTDIGTLCLEQMRYRLKFPQHSNIGHTFKPNGYGTTDIDSWRNQNYIFTSGKYYTLAKYHGIVSNNTSNNDNSQEPDSSTISGFLKKDCVNTCVSNDPNWSVGSVVTNNPSNSYEYPSNFTYDDGTNKGFALRWMHINIFLPQIGRPTTDTKSEACDTCWVFTNTHFAPILWRDETYNSFFVYDNMQNFVAKETNTACFPRSDLNWTDIVEVPEEDIITMSNITTKSFTDSSASKILVGDKYRNNSYIPTTSGSDNNWSYAKPNIGASTGYNDDVSWFYKGYCGSDVIQYMRDLCIV